MKQNNYRWQRIILNLTRWIIMGLTTIIGAIALIGTLSFFIYWIYIILHPLNSPLPGDLRPLLLVFYSRIFLVLCSIETLLIWLLTRLRWISRSRDRVGIRIFGVIAVLMMLAMLYLFRIQIQLLLHCWMGSYC